MGGGLDAGGGLAAALVVQLSGTKGSQVFSFGAGTLGGDIANAINLVSDATGVTATFGGSTLTMKAADYGTKGFVDVSVISEGGGGAFATGLSATRASGANAVASINGIAATADGNDVSVNTATLSMKATLKAAQTGAFALTISGGGALFQLGPDVVANQQSRIGVQSVDTGRLGGGSGRLYQLGTGGSAALATSATTAANIVDEAVTKVSSLRGRLGAFQKTTLDSNIASLNETLENLTNAESSIRDADFAIETARLTRAQILVQSGTSVLALANQAPQNVLALLRS
jgi:flagellin